MQFSLPYPPTQIHVPEFQQEARKRYHDSGFEIILFQSLHKDFRGIPFPHPHVHVAGPHAEA